MSVTGGAPVSLYPVTNPWGATWMEDNRIVFTDPGFGGQGLLVISADGGEPTVYSTPDDSRGEIDHSFPESIAGGSSSSLWWN